MKPTHRLSVLAALLVFALPGPLAAQSADNSASSENSTDVESDTPESGGQPSGEASPETGSPTDEEASDAEEANSNRATGDDGSESEASGAGEESPRQQSAAEDSADQEGADDFEMPGQTTSGSADSGAQAQEATDGQQGDESTERKEGRTGAAEGDAETESARTDEGESSQSESPISDLAGDGSQSDDEFEPVEDIEENELEGLTPARVYPYLEWDGAFRLRSEAAVNFDLNTGGTSAVLPPAENGLPDDDPANPNNGLLWSTDMNLRLEPTFHITEGLRVHTEVTLLDNLVLGSLADQRIAAPDSSAIRPDPSRTVHSSNQIPPREAEAFTNSIRVNELYGSAHTFLGTLKAGRMDYDWGMGLYADGGDCADCDYGDHVDRIMFRTKLWKFYTTAAYDFADQGETTRLQSRAEGQARDVSQIDDARQMTFMVAKKPRTKKEKKVQRQRLEQQNKPAFNGGVLFSYRTQKGQFTRPSSETRASSAEGARVDQSNQNAGQNPGAKPELVYRGLKMYVPDIWFQFLYNPDQSTKIRFELEGTGVFGSMDNRADEAPSENVNCFRQGQRESNPGECKQNEKQLTQFGGAFESEFYFGGPVRFGLNGGYASGGGGPGTSPWGYGADDGGELDFFRFDPNYHVDLILFREVVGTVTNAYYGNPYVQARFLESQDRRFQAQIDLIASGVADKQGAPAGQSNWLGFEIDGSLQYLQTDTFRAGLQAGVLFPGTALDARLKEQKVTVPFGDTGASRTFRQGRDATAAWTVQTNFAWMF